MVTLVEGISCNLGWNQTTLAFGEMLHQAPENPFVSARLADVWRQMQ